jgi:WD40 repeat protein
MNQQLPTAAASSLAVSSSGDLIAVGDASGVVHIWSDRQVRMLTSLLQDFGRIT